MLLNALIKKDPLLMTSSVSEFKPILDKCSWANTWILYIAWIFQKIICERISLWIWHIKTSKCSGLAGSSTKQMAFAECTSMQWCLHESRGLWCRFISPQVFRERRFHSDSPSLTSEDTTESSKVRQVDKDDNTTFLIFHSASTEENPAEMWEEWLAGADFWKGLQWNLSALLPLLS